MKVPLTNPYREIENLKNINQKIDAVIKSGAYIGGEVVSDFENRLKKLLDVKYISTVNSGTDALTISLLAMGVGEGDEVIVPSFTFFASVESILLVGATPIFVDINLSNYCIDIIDLKNKITKKTKVILPVHLFGNNAEIEELVKISKKQNIKILEDAAQSFGSKNLDNNYLGTIGDIGAFSFYPSKTLGGIGDGGMIATNNLNYYKKIEKIKNHGQSQNYKHELVGMNSRLDAINAVVLNEKLKIFEKIKFSRNSFYNHYIDNLEKLDWLKLPSKENPNILFNYFTVFLNTNKRTKLMGFLEENKIGYSIYYKTPIHQQPVTKKLLSKKIILKNTEIASRSVLSLPLFPFAKNNEMDFVVSKLLEFRP